MLMVLYIETERQKKKALQPKSFCETQPNAGNVFPVLI